jgi:hypothetical protein
MGDAVTVRRGEGAYAASHEFIVTQPDGSETTVWSPPGHEMTPEQGEAGALLAAQAFWDHRNEPDFKFYYHPVLEEVNDDPA